MEKVDLRCRILYNLYRHQYWGGRHTSVENAIKAIPSHFLGKAKKEMDKLIKGNLILSKPTAYGLQISLNPAMKAEIEKSLESIKLKYKYNIILK